MSWQNVIMGLLNCPACQGGIRSAAVACVYTCKLRSAHIHHFAHGHRRASLLLDVCFPGTLNSHMRCCCFPSILHLILISPHRFSWQHVPDRPGLVLQG